MPLLGSHQSIAGGYYKALETAAELGMDCVQIFTKNNNQWKGKPLTDVDISLFREAVARTGIRMPCAHDSYLINLASADETLWTRSLDAFVVELERAEALGLAGVVMHPGSCVGASEEDSIARVVTGLGKAIDRTQGDSVEVWIEATAGQGSSLGHRFEHLRAILDGLEMHPRVGICIDSCHLFAAGYPLSLPTDYAETMRQFDEIVGIDRIRAFHLNDSKRELAAESTGTSTSARVTWVAKHFATFSTTNASPVSRCTWRRRRGQKTGDRSMRPIWQPCADSQVERPSQRIVGRTVKLI